MNFAAKGHELWRALAPFRTAVLIRYGFEIQCLALLQLRDFLNFVVSIVGLSR
jgi:hypothetical protein